MLARSLPYGLNPVDIGDQTFATRLRSLVLPLWRCLKARPERVHAYVALAGTGSPSLARKCKAVTSEVLRSLGCRPNIHLMTDADLLIHAYLERQDGIVLIAGTGSICIAVKRQGRHTVSARVGGWGAWLDDGSGSRLGLRTLGRALRALDGRAPRGRLVDSLCDMYGLKLEEIPERFLPPGRASVAGLAEAALEAYLLGDPFARQIVRETARDLTAMVEAAGRRAGLGPKLKVVASGGLFKSPVIRRLFKAGLKRLLPRAETEVADDPLLRLLETVRKSRRR
jgi:N-acetylglucosamine kinase-like BadF-type ATPase